MMARAALLLLPLLALLGAAPPPGPALLDSFDTVADWKVSASDGVTGTASEVAGAHGGALRLDYDFTKGSGYTVVRRVLPIDLTGNFRLRFKLRGEGPANALEVKLTDASADNVWWHRFPDLVPPREWTDISIKRRQVDFAWGPTSDKTLRSAAAIEFVVAAGKGGGKGWIALDDLTLERLPDDPATPPPLVAAGPGARAVDGNPATAWTGCGGAPLDIDLGYQREFGGLELHWGPRAAADYTVALSADGNAWRPVRTVHGGDGGTDWLKLSESEARFVRIQPAGPACVDLAEVAVKPLAFGATDTAFVTAIAGEQRRGLNPRGYVGEQSYWTLVATPRGEVSGLIDESGAIENAPGGFSVEPFVRDGGRLATWADADVSQSLPDGYLPLPKVRWTTPGWSLDVGAIADRDGRLVARYTLTNRGSMPRSLDLLLAVRPLQVNPPQQFLNITGGVSPIGSLGWDGRALVVNGAARVQPAAPPYAVRLAAFDSGPLPEGLDRAGSSPITDPTGLASGALVYRVTLLPGATRAFALALSPGAGRSFTLADAAAAEEQAAAEWRERLGRVELSGPPAAQPVLATLRSALAQVLMSRDGPALRPGTRSYARSWIRDGSMMSDALLRLGETAAARDFLAWYAPFQYADGKVPCCVDRRGADPVPENDSDGEFIHLAADLQRFAPNAARSTAVWPRVRAAADHIEALRAEERAADAGHPERAHFAGLLTPSISHEGYSAKAMHSYWDDFWALAGARDAAWLAGALGKASEAALLQRRADAFDADILASLAKARALHRIAFIPGSADLGDYDATSTTIALSVAGEQARLPQPALRATFERYWAESLARIDGSRAWEDYTPYEWRTVGAFVRLGWRDRANRMVDFFMKDRRPVAWNQWAEVVGRDIRKPRFIGDMPHGWVASDFINAALDMLAYHRDRDDSLVLAAGVPAAWTEGPGLSVGRLRTPYGALSYTLRGDRLTWRLDGRPPRGGLVFAGPGLAGERRLAGRSGAVEFHDNRRTERFSASLPAPMGAP